MTFNEKEIKPTAEELEGKSSTQVRTLRLGDSGPDVFEMQMKLINHHYFFGLSDGYFDASTEWAVKYFQSRNYLATDGIAGPATMAALNSPSARRGVDNAVTGRGPQGPAESQLKMGDYLWSNVPFDAAGTPQVETIGSSANAPAAIAIAFSTLFENAITPPVVCNFVMNNGLRDHTGNAGVISSFFVRVAGEYDVQYHGTTNSIAAIQTHCQNGGIAVVRVVGNAAHNYCSLNGATYLVVYKVDNNYVYIQNSNGNASGANVPRSVWNNATWVREAHLYQTGYGA